jgi:hypothetical protein
VNGKRKVEHKPESNNNPSEHIACWGIVAVCQKRRWDLNTPNKKCIWKVSYELHEVCPPLLIVCRSGIG